MENLYDFCNEYIRGYVEENEITVPEHGDPERAVESALMHFNAEQNGEDI